MLGCLRSLSQNPHKALAHLTLRFFDMSRERGKIRQVGGAGEKTEDA